MTPAGLLIRAALLLTLAYPVGAQTPDAPSTVRPAASQPETGKSAASAQQAAAAAAEWQRLAGRAETALLDRGTPDFRLETLRTQLVEWRQTLLAAQSTNATRIATLRNQISALGPVPAEGETESDEIASRRAELSEQLVQAQAPGIAADEAYRRADGLIREIDSLLRERQTDQLLQLWPSPVNPANFPSAAKGVLLAAQSMSAEVQARLASPSVQRELRGNLPLIAGYMLVGLGLILRARRILERVATRISGDALTPWRRIGLLLVSMGQMVLPLVGLLLINEAMQLTSIFGSLGTAVVAGVISTGITIALATWLGRRIFPKVPGRDAPLHLPPERRAEGRILAGGLGLVIGIDSLREAAVGTARVGEAASSVLSFPLVVVAGLLLVRMGQLLRLHAMTATSDADGSSFRDRLIGVFGKAAMAIGCLGPVLGVIGYIPAAVAIVYPAAISLAILGLMFILQRLVSDIYGLLTGRTDGDNDALLPVLIGFGLTLGSVPLFALVWGARAADLGELWVRFREGFSIGETRIAPADFLVFAAIFGAGYVVTRLFQGALRSSVLPRTRLDQGGQNAVLAGVGYVGIFIAGLIAINSAGINLSGFAIVAGALSVGIGFGMQNIVSNFVSGIILLIERPISEGDWIEVGGAQGIVKSISVRSTRIQTFDRTDVIVPNADLVTGQVTNWTRFNMSGRLIVPISVVHGSDTRLVERLLREIAEAEPLALLNPPPLVVFMGMTLDAMNFEVRMILRDVNFSLTVRSEMNHEIIRRFREAGVIIPFVQREIRLHGVTGADQLAADTADKDTR